MASWDLVWRKVTRNHLAKRTFQNFPGGACTLIPKVLVCFARHSLCRIWLDRFFLLPIIVLAMEPGWLGPEWYKPKRTAMLSQVSIWNHICDGCIAMHTEDAIHNRQCHLTMSWSNFLAFPFLRTSEESFITGRSPASYSYMQHNHQSLLNELWPMTLGKERTHEHVG